MSDNRVELDSMDTEVPNSYPYLDAQEEPGSHEWLWLLVALAFVIALCLGSFFMGKSQAVPVVATETITVTAYVPDPYYVYVPCGQESIPTSTAEPTTGGNKPGNSPDPGRVHPKDPEPAPQPTSVPKTPSGANNDPGTGPLRPSNAAPNPGMPEPVF